MDRESCVCFEDTMAPRAPSAMTKARICHLACAVVVSADTPYTLKSFSETACLL
ncbi:hypothetical protein JB92DRAFT_3041677, partial [Gautieria morchelliformis]